MPPTIGAAMGFITSDPTPVSHRIGARLARTAATVISFGRKRWTAPSMAACSISTRCSDGAGGELPVERFVQIDDHHNASLDRDSEQRDVANPDRNTEIVAKEPLEKKASRHRIERRKDQNQRFGHGTEHHIQQHKDRDEDDRQNDLQPLLGAQFEFIFARPLQAVAGRQMEFLLQEFVGPGDEAAIVPSVQIQVRRIR